MAWLERLEEWLIALLLAVMTSITFTQVIARYVFNYSFVWALELVTVLFAWLIFLGMSYGVRVHAHIGVDALVKSVPPAVARIMSGIGALLCVAYALIILVGGWTYMQKIYSIGIEMQDIPVAQWVPRTILPLGFALLAFRFFQVFVTILRGGSVALVGDEAEEALKLRADKAPDDGARP
jgi:C4-dicarboxylate transporter DctQ subunit